MFRKVPKESNTRSVLFCFVVTILILHTLSRGFKAEDNIPEYKDNQIANTPMGGCDGSKVVVPAVFGSIVSKPSRSSAAIVRYGTFYGGFNLPGNDMCWLAEPDPEGIIVYSFGVGEDCSWDISLASLAPGKIKIFLFDPTPRAKQHFDAVRHTLETKSIPQAYEGGRVQDYVNPSTGEKSEISGGVDASKWFEQVARSNVRSSDLTFQPYGLWNTDTQLEFFAPGSGVSHSFTAKGSGKSIKVEAKRLSTLMTMFAHKRLDILKFDVEGAEVQVVPDMVAYFKESGIWPKMILFDHDSLRGKGQRYKLQDALKTPDIVIKTLLDAGYRLFSYHNFDAVFVLNRL